MATICQFPDRAQSPNAGVYYGVRFANGCEQIVPMPRDFGMAIKNVRPTLVREADRHGAN